MAPSYVIGNQLQPAALLTRETANATTFKVDDLVTPKKSDTGESANGPKNDFPYDYYSGGLEAQYPDDSTSRTVYIPDVIIYNNSRVVGATDRWPLGFKRDVVAYLEPGIKKAYPTFEFSNRRFAATPDTVWLEGKVYHSRPNRPSQPVQVEVVRGNNRVPYNGLDDLFHHFPTYVAFRGNLVASCKLQAEVKKGAKYSPNVKAGPIFTPVQFMVKGPINIPEPVSVSLQKTVASSQDNADDSFWDLVEKMSKTSTTDDANKDDDEFTDSDE